jgi:hypothetical protein
VVLSGRPDRRAALLESAAMTKSASRHITALPGERTDPSAITAHPAHLPKEPPPPAPQPPATSLGYRIALLVWVAGFVLLALQLVSEPIQRLLHLVGLLR